jgi:APA family basic amino acid/polyamine antiporter
MPSENRPPRIVPAVGLAGCLLLAFTLPVTSVRGVRQCWCWGLRYAVNARRTS